MFDMRTAAEREAEPDVVPDGTEQLVCDVLKDSQTAAPAQLLKVLSDPALAEQMLGGDKALQLFERGYREIVSLPSALTAYREFFTAIAQDAHRPALFHCTTGKDRTGWAAAATLLLLGVSEEDVLYDYELTNRDLLPALKPVFEHFRAAGGNPRLLEPVLGVDADYLRTALDEMTQRFGSIEAYFEEGLGIDTRRAARAARHARRIIGTRRHRPRPPLGLRRPPGNPCNSSGRTGHSPIVPVPSSKTTRMGKARSGQRSCRRQSRWFSERGAHADEPLVVIDQQPDRRDAHDAFAVEKRNRSKARQTWR